MWTADCPFQTPRKESGIMSFHCAKTGCAVAYASRGVMKRGGQSQEASGEGRVVDRRLATRPLLWRSSPFSLLFILSSCLRPFDFEKRQHGFCQ